MLGADPLSGAAARYWKKIKLFVTAIDKKQSGS
jgi:hypothetical protein